MSDSGNQILYHSQSLDNINSLLQIKTEEEMFQKISLNIPKIYQIFKSFKAKFYNNQINQNDITQIMEALKFIDNLNLFMEEIDVKNFKDKMEEFEIILKKRNYNKFYENVLNQLQYTIMTIIYHRKKDYRNMYFNNNIGLSEELEKELEQVNKMNNFNFRLFKQMQNIFWVVKNVIEKQKKNELEIKFNNLKNISKIMKDRKYNNSHYSNQGYRNYNDYSDYKNYAGTNDYNSNFYRNNDTGYYNNRQLKYDDYNINNNYDMGMRSKNYKNQRGGFRKNNFNININSQNRKNYYMKKQEEKEIEIPSDPGYFNKKEEEDLKEENNEIIDNNNINEYNKINGGNDLNIETNNNSINNYINNSNNIINTNNSNENIFNGGIREEINYTLEENTNIENNGGNGDNSNINNPNNELNNKNNNDIEIITEIPNLTQNNSVNYKRKIKNIYQNKMIAGEMPISQSAEENHNIPSKNENNINNENSRENIEENNNGSTIENNINSNNNKIVYNNNQNNLNNNKNYENIGEIHFNSNIEIKPFNNNYNNKCKNYYYNNNRFKPNLYNNYNRYNNIQNNINITNEKNFISPNKKREFVEIHENNNIILNNINNDNKNVEFNNQNNLNQNINLINGQEKENINIDNNVIILNQNEPNGEVLRQKNQNIINTNLNDINIDLNKNEKQEVIDKNSNLKEISNNNTNNTEINININENNILLNENIDNINEYNDININFKIDLNEINGIDKNENSSFKIKKNDNPVNNIINENFGLIPQNEEDKEKNTINNQLNYNFIQKEEKEENNNLNIGNNNELNNDINNDMNNLYLKNEFNHIQDLDEEEKNINNEESNEHMQIEENEDFFDEQINLRGEFNKFMIEAIGQEPKGDYQLKNNCSDEKEEDEKIDNNFYTENDLVENFYFDLEKEKFLAMNDEEQAIEIKIRELIQKLDIPKIIESAEDELEQEELKKENINNNKQDQSNKSNKYIDTVKDMDQELKDKIKDKLRTNFKNQEFLAPKFTFYTNNLFNQNTQMFDNNLYALIQNYKKNSSINKNNNMNNNLFNYIFSTNIIPPTKENEVYRQYLFLKILEVDYPQLILINMQNFEKKILIPLYLKIIEHRDKQYNLLEHLYYLYKNAIEITFKNSKEAIIEKIQKYGSFANTFMVDIGDTDIDICIVPKCSLSEFKKYYLEKLKKGIMKQNLGEINKVIVTTNYILLKIIYNHSKSKFNVDITVHNMLPIFNTHLIRKYGLFDQRFHIMGIYLKYWAKTNNLHGALANYLSSYALLLMIIHFLQKVVEPKILPNLQKIPINNDLNRPIYGNETYEYYFNEKKITTNSFYEKDDIKIKEYMNNLNDFKKNEETVTNLIVKFFEYYAYFYDSKHKISVHKELIESIKERDDDIAFSIDDPFETTNNPGKSMLKNSESYNKFIEAMKKEVNFILSGEYVKRFESIVNKY